MITTGNAPPQLGASPLALSSLARTMLDPVMAIVTLFGAALAFRVPFEGPYIILSLLVFSLTFPASASRGTSVGALIRQVLADWMLVVGLLLLLGWVTRTLGSVDEYVFAAWVAFTPVSIVGARLMLPSVMPRLLAADGLQRVAVIAGAGPVGRNLAERIAQTPFLGVRVAGFFDDRARDRVPLVDGAQMLGNLDQVADYARKNHVDLIYLALPMASQPRIMKVLDELHDTTASIYFAPDIFLFDLIQARVESIAGFPVVAM
jgi:putative colanic acid biosynthesis UDP-glucose lipid carrier transferase